jgi:hypothetical protein
MFPCRMLLVLIPVASMNNIMNVILGDLVEREPCDEHPRFVFN